MEPFPWGTGTWALELALRKARLVLATTGRETEAKQCHVSEPQFPLLYKGDNNITYTPLYNKITSCWKYPCYYYS